MHSGFRLEVCQGGLYVACSGQKFVVVRFSKSFNEKLNRLCQKGYEPLRGDIRFVVAWRSEEDTTETAVLLPNLYLKRR